MNLRVAFAGTPDFARLALDAVLAAGFTVPLVLTQPDRPAGRGLKLQASPVKQCALAHGLPLAQPRSLRLDGRWPGDALAAETALQAAAPDVMVVAAYGLMLPPWVLALPPHGCLNIHASLLPRWRGAAPIHRAVEAGDAVTGITIMQMDAGLDTGPMLLAESLAIAAADSTATLHDRLAALGARLVVQTLRALAAGSLQPTAQPAQGACYAHKVEKAEAAIDWSAPAALIERRVRAFDPFPGASFEIDGQPVKLWRARCVDGAVAQDRVQGRAHGVSLGLSSDMAPGTVLEAGNDRLVVACGEGALELLELQRTGGRRVGAAQFLHGHPVAAGRVLASGMA